MNIGGKFGSITEFLVPKAVPVVCETKLDVGFCAAYVLFGSVVGCYGRFIYHACSSAISTQTVTVACQI